MDVVEPGRSRQPTEAQAVTPLTRRLFLGGVGALSVAPSAQAADAVEVAHTDGSHRCVRIAHAGTGSVILDAQDFDGLAPEDSRGGPRACFRIHREPGLSVIHLVEGGLHPRAPLLLELVIGNRAVDADLRPLAQGATLEANLQLAGQALRLAPATGGGLLGWLAEPSLTLTRLPAAAVDRILARLFGERVRTAAEGGQPRHEGFALKLGWPVAEGQLTRPAEWELLGKGAFGFRIWRGALGFSELHFGRRIAHGRLRERLARLFPDATLPRPTPAGRRVRAGVPSLLACTCGEVRQFEPFIAAEVPARAVLPARLAIEKDAVAGLRTREDERHAVSAVAAPMRLEFGQGERAEGPFLASRGLVLRGRGLPGEMENAVTTRIMLVPQANDWRLRTRHGALGVQGGPEDGRAIERATVPILMEWQDTRAGTRAVTRFRAELFLRDAGIPVQADGQAGLAQAVPWSRLDFETPTRCGFSLGALPGAEPPERFPCFVALGRQAAGDFCDPPLRLALDTAVLRAARPRDLLWLSWRFRGMLLEVDGPGARLAVDRRISAVPRAAVQAAPDMRPLLIVEFPPQHMAELTYFRPRRGVLPEAALPADDATPGLLERLEDPDVRARMAAREEIQRRMIAGLGDAPEGAGPSPRAAFAAFCAAYRKEASRQFLREELRTYVGRHARDPEAPEIGRAALHKVDPLARLSTLPERPPEPSGPSKPEVRPDEDFAGFQSFYTRTEKPPAAALPAVYLGRAAFISYLGTLANDEAKKAAAAAVLDLFDRYDRELDESVDPFREVTPARSAGGSRLVFRMDSARVRWLGHPPGTMPFRLDALTDWGGLELAVVRRAEILFEQRPDSPVRIPSRDGAKLLRFQNLSETRLNWLGQRRRVPWRQRLREVAASAREAPQPHETSIELPARLMLSTAQDAVWHTPRTLPILDPARLGAPLWTANMLPDPAAPGVRAIWSPDFAPDALLGDGGTEVVPQHRLHAPWPVPEGEKRDFRLPTDARDRHEIVALSSLHGLVVQARRTGTAIDDNSQYEQPPAFEVDGLAPLGPEGPAVYRAKPLDVTRLALSSLGATAEMDTGFTPPSAAIPPGTRDGTPPAFAFSVERWMQRSVLGRDVEVEVQYRGYLFPIGVRAVLVKRTERGFRRRIQGGPPIAYLIQRKFLRIVEPTKGYPAPFQAFDGRRWCLESLQLLQTQSPDLVDPLADDPPAVAGNGITTGSHGRIWVTVSHAAEVGRFRQPDGLIFWPRTTRREGAEAGFPMRLVSLNGRAGHATAPFIFVDEVAANDAGAMRRLADWYNGMKGADGNADARRVLRLNGANLCYAREERPGQNSTLTHSWTLGAEGRSEPGLPLFNEGTANTTDFQFSPQLKGRDQPPFYPFLQEGQIELGAVQRFTGQTPQPVKVTFHPPYVENGFLELDGRNPDLAARADVFLLLRDDIEMTMSQGGRAAGARSGGIAQPNLQVVGLSRRAGPIGNNVGSGSNQEGGAKAPDAGLEIVKQVNPAKLFKGAKLLGAVDLAEILEAFAGAAVPKLLESTGYGIGDLTAATAGVLRTEVLEPIRAALAEVEDQYQQQSGRNLLPELLRGMPRLAQAWSDLRRALDAAIAATRQANLAELASQLAEVYAAGTRVVSGLAEVARDPASVAGNLIGQLQRFLVDRILPVDSVPFDLTEGIKTALKTVLETGVAQILSLPLTATMPDLTEDVRRRIVDEIQGTVEALLGEAPPAEITALLSDPGPITARRAAARTAALLRDRLTTRLEAVEGELERRAAGVLRAVDEAADLAGPTILLPALLLALSGLRLPADTDVRKQIENLAQRLAGQAIDQVRTELSAAAWVGLDASCGGIEGLLKNFIRATLPDADPLRDCAPMQGCLLLPAAPTDAAAFCRGLAETIAAVQRLRPEMPPRVAVAADDLIQALCRTAEDLGRALEQTAASIGALQSWARRPVGCQALAELPLYELERTARAVDRLFAAQAEQRRAFAERLRALVLAAEVHADAVMQLRIREALHPYLAVAWTVVRDLTALGAAAEAERRVALEALSAEGLRALTAVYELRGRAEAVARDLQKAADEVEQAALGGLVMALAELEAVLTDLTERFAGVLQRAALDLLRQGVNRGLGLAERFDVLIAPLLRPQLRLAGEAHGWAQRLIAAVRQRLDGNNAFAEILSLLTIRRDGADAIVADREGMLLAADAAPSRVVSEYLRYAALAAGQSLGLQLLGSQLGRLETAVGRAVTGALAQMLDLNGLRQRLEERLRDLIPTKAKLDYALELEMKQTPAGPITFTPTGEGTEKRLTLRSTVEVDLLRAAQGEIRPRMSLTGRAGPFAIDLLGFVEFSFAGLSFESDGGTPRFKADFRGVTPKDKLKYLENLKSILGPKDGNGPFVILDPRGRGVKAGYRLNLGTVTLPPINFMNLSLNAGLDLPFGDGEATFFVSLGSRASPFIISSPPYGGGGFLELAGTGKGIKSISMAFQFGGAASFSFGPLDGYGFAMAGLFIEVNNNAGGSKTIEGYFLASGSAQISCFGLSTTIYIGVRNNHGSGGATGFAQYSFSFGVGLARVRFSLRAEKMLGGPGQSAALPPATLFAGPGAAEATSPFTTHEHRNEAAGAAEDWLRLVRYLDLSLLPGRLRPARPARRQL